MFKNLRNDINVTVDYLLQNKHKMTIGEKAKYIGINVTGMTLVFIARPVVVVIEKLKETESDLALKIAMKD